MKKILCFFLLALSMPSQAQKKSDPVYVDKEGVLRWTKDQSEAVFFGANYTVPFAYGYRSHKALGIHPEKAIDLDVVHMSRLGLDAFRVHVWDVEISDSLGNLLKNEHLRLFDYLIHKLKQVNIKILITPIAFWGNGYPERDIRTNGFSYVYGKGGAVVKEEAFRAQENYLKQFFTHVNPYTKLAYKDDPDVIAMEINNEPHHSGPKSRTTAYVNRMAAAVRSTGWTKPIFYNISESPGYADAVVKAKVNGHSFQWYPTGLVANHERKGNFLPNVSQYHIPFGDTIPAFNKRALMVYEFDAADVMQPVMYPAIARSYRAAGFQWATQFAYDPLFTAYGNTEYQTHYLNLVYTPAKAISLLIAAKVFHRLPRKKTYGSYPADSLFDVFRVSYKQQLSEMNSEEEFYYTNHTNTVPKAVHRLHHIAGVGQSHVIRYEGTGAYFLDKLHDHLWQLDVMPDAVTVSDPFEKASPKKQVVKIALATHRMSVHLPQLKGFRIVSIEQPQKVISTDLEAGFMIRPGTYLITDGGVSLPPTSKEEFSWEALASHEMTISHEPPSVLQAGRPYALQATVFGFDTAYRFSVEVRNAANQWRTLQMQKISAYRYEALLPVDLLQAGTVNYRIMARKPGADTLTFPGGFKGNPYAWDEWRNESWETFVAAPGSPIEIFNATRDRSRIMLYNTDWRNNTVAGVATDHPYQLALKTSMNKPNKGQLMGWQFYFGEKISGRREEMPEATKISLRARSSGRVNATIALIDLDGFAYSTTVPLHAGWQELDIPFTALKKDACLLLPRPFPGFQKLWFAASGEKAFRIADMEKLEIRFTAADDHPSGIEVERVWLKQ